MDMEFIVQDMYAVTRPQWKLASNLEEAAKTFQTALSQHQRTAGLEKTAEADDGSSASSTDDENADADLPEADGEGEDELGSEDEDAEVSPTVPSQALALGINEALLWQDPDVHGSARDTESEDEAIVVTRPEEEIDPEDEAEFEREYAKMMSESLESRKFERKPLFDVALPVRHRGKDVQGGADGGDGAEQASASNTMAFSLLTKRGNRQQVRSSAAQAAYIRRALTRDRPAPWSCRRTRHSLSRCAINRRPRGRNSAASRTWFLTTI
jgi:regulator of nonsense transcripts 2